MAQDHFVTCDPDGPLSEEFWLHELGFKQYPNLSGRDQVSWAHKKMGDFFKGDVAQQVLERLLEASSNPTALRFNLAVLGEWLSGIHRRGIEDVAYAVLDNKALETLVPDHEELPRIPAVATLFCNDPRHLVSILVCDRWNQRRRCVMRVQGRAPRPKRPLEPSIVTEAATTGLNRILAHSDKMRENFEGTRLLQVFQRSEGEIIVSFRRPIGISGVRRGRRLITGSNDEYVVLRFREGGRTVDVTARRLEDAIELAGAIGAVLLNTTSVEYVKRRGQVTSTVLSDLLELLVAPDNELALVEIKAEMPGEPGCFFKTIRSSGTERIEETVQREASRATFARDWKTVHYVKVLFEGYRFLVHFPDADEVETKLSLTYSDQDKDTGISEKFEEFIEFLGDNLGARMNVVPRTKDVKRRLHSLKKPGPARLGQQHWHRLLSPSIGHPLDWERKRLDKLQDDGLVRIRTAWFFRCGDPTIDREQARVPRSTLDCQGTVEWETGSSEDPVSGLYSEEVLCDECRQAWKPGHHTPPLRRRLYLSYQHDAIWRYTLSEFGKLMDALTIEASGMASGLRRGRRVYLVYTPLMPSNEAAPHLGSQPVLWIAPPDHPSLQGLVDGVCTLAQVMTSKTSRVRVLDEVRDDLGGDSKPAILRHTQGRKQLSLTSPHPRSGRSGWNNPGPEAAPPPHGLLHLLDNFSLQFCAFKNEDQLSSSHAYAVWKVSRANPRSTLLLLTLLVEARRRDLEQGDTVNYWTIEELTALDPQVQRTVKPANMQAWVSRFKKKLDEVVGSGVGPLLVESTSSQGGERSEPVGYRLGARYEVADFQFSTLIDKWKSQHKS
ncbi:MAG: hypothetical protein H6739_04860 [Alphaproteobacteria bacterium]|nr:hypothetical protein [Alphaproteobacteria bacterium]